MKQTLIILALFCGCTPFTEKTSKIDEYYPLDSLINTQIKLLVEEDQQVRKSVWLDGESEDTVLSFTQSSWQDELKLFFDADINKPAYSGLYTWEKRLEDPGSNLFYDRFIPKKGNTPAIKRFEIYYYESLDQVKRIVIEASEKNELYFSNKTLSMNFRTRKGIPIVSSYSISGDQKLVMRDSVRYEILGELLVD